METTNIYVMQDLSSAKGKNCIEVQLGKQRKKRNKSSSVYFTPEAFGPLEQTIWDNFREYQSGAIAKIHSSEWQKIVRGFAELSAALKKSDLSRDTLELLGFNEMLTRDYYKENHESINVNVDVMLHQFIDWINEAIKDNEYITICGK